MYSDLTTLPADIICGSEVKVCACSSRHVVLGPALAALQARSRDVVVLAKQEDDLDSMMAEDMQQFAAKPVSKDMPTGKTSAPEASEGGLKDVLDKVCATAPTDCPLGGLPLFLQFLL